MEGKLAVAKALRRHRDPKSNPTNQGLLTLLNLVSTNMQQFHFQPKTLPTSWWNQMGTKLAPSFANLFMGDFEDKFVFNYPLQPLLWLRYIDILTIWPHGQTTFESVSDHLNTCHKTKFTAHISPTHAIFLNTTPDGSLRSTIIEGRVEGRGAIAPLKREALIIVLGLVEISRD